MGPMSTTEERPDDGRSHARVHEHLLAEAERAVAEGR